MLAFNLYAESGGAEAEGSSERERPKSIQCHRKRLVVAAVTALVGQAGQFIRLRNI